MRILLFFVILLLLSNCTTIEVAKEVSKASKSIKNSVQKVIKNDDQSNNDNSVKNEKEKLVTQDENISLEEKVDLFKKEMWMRNSKQSIITLNYGDKISNIIGYNT